MFLLPDLPYATDALAPVLSADALRLHHGQLHAAYLKRLNTLLAELPGTSGPLESVIDAAGALADPALFHNAAQCWTHSLSWQCMSPVRAAPPTRLSAEITAQFGGHAGLRSALVAAGLAQFGSGWLWLISDGQGGLTVATTPDARPVLVAAGQVALLVCDLWEHAYDLDHQDDRGAYLGGWFDQLANWTFAGRQHAAAIRGEGAWRHPPPVRLAA